MDDQQLVSGQLSYYRARAAEYDEWFLRQGRYDRGPQQREDWFREIATVEAKVLPWVRGQNVLELAAGTGLWTKRLLDAGAGRIFAVDGSPEALEINQVRANSPAIEYQIADIFSWSPPETFDIVFFSFWLSHVPRARFNMFWELVRRSLRPQGKALFVDSLLERMSTATDHEAPDRSGIAERKLNDGREFQIVKIFYDPDDLQTRLTGLGWQGSIQISGKFFLFGSMGHSPGR